MQGEMAASYFKKSAGWQLHIEWPAWEVEQEAWETVKDYSLYL